MAEYIEREAVMERLTYYPISNPEPMDIIPAVLETARKTVAKIPAADVAPVVHGRWIEKQEPLSWCEDDVDVFWECSACKTANFGESPYCPNCGARMDGE